ncbi:uncharacterized protein LOC144640791 [Oculina patagonica]
MTAHHSASAKILQKDPANIKALEENMTSFRMDLVEKTKETETLRLSLHRLQEKMARLDSAFTESRTNNTQMKCSSSQNSNGAIKFTDTADNCTQQTAGTVHYSNSQETLQLCDGSAWLPLVTAKKGHVANRTGRHCQEILNSGQSRGNGLYWIDPNGGSTDDSFQAFCDMETERGGWTLVATKVTPSFLFITAGFSTLAAKTKNADAASHIHPDMGDWEEVMFRFADVNTIRVIYNRTAGAPQNDKTEFDEFLMGKSGLFKKNVYGFYKYSPADNNQRSPAVGFATITNLGFYSTHGISEDHGGTDKWLGMWSSGDSHSNNYVTSDDSRAIGTKCIAGYCYLNKPIWVMVR